MKLLNSRKCRSIGAWVLFGIMVFMTMTGGCGGGGGEGNGRPPSPGERELVIAPSRLSLKVGEMGTLVAYNVKGGLVWQSQNANITVNPTNFTTATVVALAAGETNVVAFDSSGARAMCRVTVTEGTASPILNLTITPSALSLKIGGSGMLLAENYAGDLTWFSDTPNVAWVAKSGPATALVTSAVAGTATITVVDGRGAAATCSVTVTEESGTLKIEPAALSLKAGETGSKPYRR
ncbi:MAG: hypothetical protein LBP21_10530 [Synergistaceae bacterium]|jgi:hypothetical protein|nr:hypothetical protein [Synergistaceae bacterium]